MNTRVALLLSMILALLAGFALAIELFVSHGVKDVFWFLMVLGLLAGSYALQHYARKVLIYRDSGGWRKDRSR